MKKFLIPLFLVLSACGGSGGGAGSPSGAPHIPDTTPHDYTAIFAALTNTNLVHTGTIRQECAVGYPGFRDETVNLVLVQPTLTGGVGCSAAENIIVTATNTGGEDLYLAISVDGVWLPDVLVLPGQTYTFERGY